MAAKKIAARVIDLYSVKPVDVKTLREAVRATKGRLVVVEDHYPEGGLGAAVMEALAADGLPRIVHLAVKGLPTSGNADKDFVTMMIPHHQGAIDMAKVELKFGKDTTLRAMAEKIIEAQEKEISEMNKWRAAHP